MRIKDQDRKRKGSKVITPKQWTFAGEYIRTQDKYKALDKAYPAMQTVNNSRRRDFVDRVMRQRGVVRAIDELTIELRGKEKLTIETHMAKLREIRDLALEDGKWRDALKAEELRGKCAGFYVERTMHLEMHVNQDDLLRRARQIREQYPDLTKALELGSKSSKPDSTEETEVEVVDAEYEPTG